MAATLSSVASERTQQLGLVAVQVFVTGGDNWNGIDQSVDINVHIEVGILVSDLQHFRMTISDVRRCLLTILADWKR